MGTRCALYVPREDDKKEWHLVCTVYPEDVNRRQIFDVIPEKPEALHNGVSSLKLVFESSSDFFGRIIIYDLSLDGLLF